MDDPRSYDMKSAFRGQYSCGDSSDKNSKNVRGWKLLYKKQRVGDAGKHGNCAGKQSGSITRASCEFGKQSGSIEFVSFDTGRWSCEKINQTNNLSAKALSSADEIQPVRMLCQT